MSKPHPLEQAIRVWAADPENWVWQWRAGDTWETEGDQHPPSIDTSLGWRLVPRAWFDDPESVEVWNRAQGSRDGWLRLIEPPSWDHKYNEYNIRLKPKQVTIPERTVPAPMRNIPPACGKWWVARPDLADWCDWIYWADSVANNTWLRRGLVYSTRDDAIAAAKAMTLGGQDE